MAIKTILVPTDFGHPAAVALDHALTIAEALGARLVVLHVYKAVLAPYPIALMPPRELLEEAARAELERFVRDMELPAGTETRLREGDPAPEIIEEVKASGADLVVMGTHGHRGLKRFMLGSVAEKVVRASPVPVLTARPERLGAEAVEDAGERHAAPSAPSR